MLAHKYLKLPHFFDALMSISVVEFKQFLRFFGRLDGFLFLASMELNLGQFLQFIGQFYASGPIGKLCTGNREG